MFKLFVLVLAAILAVVAAKPGYLSTGYVAPAVSYGYHGYAAPYAYSAGYAAPYSYGYGYPHSYGHYYY